jgi:hypothetical protein
MPYERFVILLESRSRIHHPHMHYFYTRGRRRHAFHLDPPKNILLLHWENTKNILYRFPPNKCSKFLCYLSNIFYSKKEAWAMQMLFTKEKRKNWKNRQVSEWLKQWVLWCPPKKKKKKRRMNKIAHVFLQMFLISNERYVFQEQSRIRIATIYISITTHICTSWFDCMTQLSLDPRFDFTIYVLYVCSFMHLP